MIHHVFDHFLISANENALKELKDGMKDIFEDLLKPLWAKVEHIIGELEKVDLEQFIGICCFCYRIVSLHHQLGKIERITGPSKWQPVVPIRTDGSGKTGPDYGHES